MPDRTADRQRGFALLIVLWTLVLLSLLVAAITASGGGRAREEADLLRNAQLRACADGGVEDALSHVLDASAARWVADGSRHRVRAAAGCVLTLSAMSQDGKVNPNTATAALLAGLLQAAGDDARGAGQLAEQMLAWRSPGSQVLPAPNREYRPPGAPFESLDELALVPGMTDALLRRILPDLTLYHDGDPNPADADALVRRALALAGSLNPYGGSGSGSGSGGDQDDAAADAPAAGPASGAARFDPAVLEVVAEAANGAGQRFRRRALVLTGAAAGEGGTGVGGGGGGGGSNQPPFRVVGWDAAGAG